jgi:hypothetical protein
LCRPEPGKRRRAEADSLPVRGNAFFRFDSSGLAAIHAKMIAIWA